MVAAGRVPADARTGRAASGRDCDDSAAGDEAEGSGAANADAEAGTDDDDDDEDEDEDAEDDAEVGGGSDGAGVGTAMADTPHNIPAGPAARADPTEDGADGASPTSPRDLAGGSARRGRPPASRSEPRPRTPPRRRRRTTSRENRSRRPDRAAARRTPAAGPLGWSRRWIFTARRGSRGGRRHADLCSPSRRRRPSVRAGVPMPGRDVVASPRRSGSLWRLARCVIIDAAFGDGRGGT